MNDKKRDTNPKGKKRFGRSRRKNKLPDDIHGLLVVNKPEGMVSKDVSRWLEKRFGRMKLGHVGTLDPGASGVLPLVFGKVTRLQDHLLGLRKTYEFEITFGVETDTLDREGSVLSEQDVPEFHRDDLERVAKKFLGPLRQTPPIYSAVKYQGKPLYEYARAGEADLVPLEELSREVEIFELEVLDAGEAPKKAAFRVCCSRGTYVRTLMQDIAKALGTIGTLSRLVRTSAAGVGIDEAMSLEEIASALGCSVADEEDQEKPERLPRSALQELLIPPEQINMEMPAWLTPSETVTQKLRMGQQVLVETAAFLANENKISQNSNLNRDDSAEIGNDKFRPQARLAMPDSMARPLMLYSDQGQLFGFGSAKMHGSGRVQVQMTRQF